MWCDWWCCHCCCCFYFFRVSTSHLHSLSTHMGDSNSTLYSTHILSHIRYIHWLQPPSHELPRNLLRSSESGRVPNSEAIFIIIMMIFQKCINVLYYLFDVHTHIHTHMHVRPHWNTKHLTAVENKVSPRVCLMLHSSCWAGTFRGSGHAIKCARIIYGHVNVIMCKANLMEHHVCPSARTHTHIFTSLIETKLALCAVSKFNFTYFSK